MSDTVFVALLTVIGSIVVMLITKYGPKPGGEGMQLFTAALQKQLQAERDARESETSELREQVRVVTTRLTTAERERLQERAFWDKQVQGLRDAMETAGLRPPPREYFLPDREPA